MKNSLLILIFFLFYLKTSAALSQNRNMPPVEAAKRNMIGKNQHWILRKFGHPDSTVFDDKGRFAYVYETKEFRNDNDIKHHNFNRPSSWYIYWFIYFSSDFLVYRIEGLDVENKINVSKIDFISVKTPAHTYPDQEKRLSSN